MSEAPTPYDTATLALAIALDQIAESPTNPRRTHNTTKDDELAESVAKLGVLQAVLVRPIEGGFELVFGHRRLRAARKVGLLAIPAFVRELSDLEVLEAQIVENTQREDVHPLEEADAYKTLHEVHGRAVDDIVAKVGKSRAYVYARLKLCALAAPARKAFFAGELTPSTALLIARIPDDKLQAEATKEITSSRYGGRVMSFRDAAEYVQRAFMLRLSEAPFSRTDLELVPAAGACSTCPKRSGNQRELFDDVKSADVCTDPICYRTKVDAEWARRRAAAEERGAVVIEGKKAEKIFPYRGEVSHGGGFIDLDQECWEDGKRRSWRTLLKKADVDVVLARDPYGEIHELVPEKEARAGAKLKSRDVSRDGRPIDSRGRNRAQALKDQILQKTCARAREQVLEKLPKLIEKGMPFWRWFARAFLEEIWHESRKTAAVARGLDLKKNRPEVALRTWIDGAELLEVERLMVELMLRRDERGSWRSDFGDQFKAGCKLAGVDLVKVKRTVAAEISAAAKTKKAATAARAKKKPAKASTSAKKATRPKRAPKVRACRTCGCTDADCSGCIEKTGEPCTWVKRDLCSACSEDAT